MVAVTGKFGQHTQYDTKTNSFPQSSLSMIFCRSLRKSLSRLFFCFANSSSGLSFSDLKGIHLSGTSFHGTENATNLRSISEPGNIKTLNGGTTTLTRPSCSAAFFLSVLCGFHNNYISPKLLDNISILL